MDATVIQYDYNKAMITSWGVTVTLYFHTLAIVPSEVHTRSVVDFSPIIPEISLSRKRNFWNT